MPLDIDEYRIDESPLTSNTRVINNILDTLAQNGTGYFGKSAIIVIGKGSELSKNKTLKGRAKRKFITQK